jgi:hypothetical protein
VFGFGHNQCRLAGRVSTCQIGGNCSAPVVNGNTVGVEQQKILDLYYKRVENEIKANTENKKVIPTKGKRYIYKANQNFTRELSDSIF